MDGCNSKKEKKKYVNGLSKNQTGNQLEKLNDMILKIKNKIKNYK
jgi:hypothetical protein